MSRHWRQLIESNVSQGSCFEPIINRTALAVVAMYTYIHHGIILRASNYFEIWWGLTLNPLSRCSRIFLPLWLHCHFYGRINELPHTFAFNVSCRNLFEIHWIIICNPSKISFFTALTAINEWMFNFNFLNRLYIHAKYNKTEVRESHR